MTSEKKENNTLKLSKRTPKFSRSEDKRVKSGARARKVALRELNTTKTTINERTETKKKSDYTTEEFVVFAPCPIGLEVPLKNELLNLGFSDAEVGKSGCKFNTNWIGVMKANLYSRIASRILVQIAHGDIKTEDEIYDLARSAPWERWFGPEHTLRVDVTGLKSTFTSLQFCNLRAKDGIVDRLRIKEGARPNIDKARPSAKVHLFIDSTSATIYLDTSGESLFKRGWRLDKGMAPIRENLAAGLLSLANWTPDIPLYDPFCGSGTILIEAAWIAKNIPPALFHPLGFERLRNHPVKIWREMKAQAKAELRADTPLKLFGTDIDNFALKAARSNMMRAGLEENEISLKVQNALESMPPCETGMILCNPPYGERLDEEDNLFWRQWSSLLKKQYAGWDINIITSDRDLPSKLRLKPRRKTPVFNGDLDCRLFNFEMVQESYRDA
ncbi:THUMP domain-containing class I SAM-dependent RNA methyltransferase [Taylorella equigenitalis]|uniref:THUMP domain-containing class I SAM-dependent RNA methyltransferase n=1 Tax=Taylorella equigenitalis TaxID=29575 RepID=UPI0023AFF99F|nr:THUMP domain-containing protein [Taylorella equigenitalis]WEE00945.1 THUMP domain-containing protein [Taylorella equigenitalis]WEE02423.1 THUMP domain-containing protein [Taylorella equigenitalis]WFD78962.1 THUMP domain-containing protein [Taylorella equigenitalis]WFD80436.1 THUMP domain-containing protein [Taylorella equigenitalis]WFD81915.1 THUMP domain-containing protein [Taylorella equigenitalis]